MPELVNVVRPQYPTYSLFIPVTRAWFIDQFLEGLDKIIIPKRQTEIIFYLDTVDWILDRKLVEWLNKCKFNGATLYRSGEVPPTEHSVTKRRDRIVEMKERSKELFAKSSEYVFGLEDDTIAPPMAFLNLEKRIRPDKVGFVQGVQVGRWRQKVLGAWRVDQVGDPNVIESILPHTKGASQIDAGGFYCYMTKTELYREAKYRWHGECFGPDVCYVLDLRKQGYYAYIDWSVVTEHHTPTKVLVPDGEVGIIRYRKVGEFWNMETEYGKAQA